MTKDCERLREIGQEAVSLFPVAKENIRKLYELIDESKEILNGYLNKECQAEREWLKGLENVLVEMLLQVKEGV